MKKINYLKASVLYNAKYNFTEDKLDGLKITTDLQDFLYNGNESINLSNSIENRYKGIMNSLTELYKSKMIVKKDQTLDRSNYDRCKTVYNFCVDVYPIYGSTIDIPGRHLPDSYDEYLEIYPMFENILPSGLVNIENLLCSVLNHLIAGMYKCISKYRMGKELILPVSSLDEYMDMSYKILAKYLLHEIEVYRESNNVYKDEVYTQNLLKCVNYYIELKGTELVDWYDIKLKIQKYKKQSEKLSSLLKEFIEDRWEDIQYTFNAVIKLSPATCLKEVNTINELILVVSTTDSLKDLNPILESNLLTMIIISSDPDEKSVLLTYQKSLRKIKELRHKIESMRRPFKPVKRRY